VTAWLRRAPRRLRSVAWLRRHWPSAALRLVDLRFPDEYVAAHIPGSSSPDLPHSLPDQARLQILLAEIDWAPEVELVLLDAHAGVLAARLFWMLECFRIHNTALLDGGLDAWKDAGLALEPGERPAPAEAAAAAPPFDPSRAAGAAELRAALNDRDAILLDVRNASEYGRELPLAGQFPAGHIPGALNLPWEETLFSPRGTIKLLQPAWALRRRLRRMGITPRRGVCVYCDTGMRSGHSYFVLRHLGFPRVQLYEGGWIEWSRLGYPTRLGPNP